jgi:hypothetical protein
MEAEDARQNRLELLATLLLAVAVVATAWSTYQGARWRGEQAAETGKATAARIESSEAATRAGQLTQIDIATFTQWVDATVSGNTELATFYERRFRDEFRPAFDAWLATQPLTDPDAPLTPFAMPDYKLAEADRASQVNREAGEHADAAGAANRNADEYLLAVVLFATALFFAALSGKLRTQVAREVVLGLGAVIFLGTVAWLVTFPVSITG